MLKLEDLTTFLKVAELGSFTRAAFSLGVAKSVVSARVTRLEEELDSHLLDRTPRGVSMTDAGKGVAMHCRLALRELDAARASAVEVPDELFGEISVTASLSFGAMFVAPAISEFVAKHPRLSFSAHYSDECVDLASSGHDIALRISYRSPQEPRAPILARMRHVVVASPNLVEKLGEPVSPGDLRSMPCLIYSGLGEVDRWQFSRDGRMIAVHVKGHVRANIVDALLASALAGGGFAYLPDFMVEEEVAAGRLVHVLPAYSSPEMVVHAVYPPAGRAPKKVLEFVAHLSERLDRGRSE